MFSAKAKAHCQSSTHFETVSFKTLLSAIITVNMGRNRQS
jgi:hypothetical protein